MKGSRRLAIMMAGLTLMCISERAGQSVPVGTAQMPISNSTELSAAGSDAEPAIQRLLAIAVDNKLSMGLVLDGKQLCDAKLPDLKEHTSIDQLIGLIEHDVPNYKATFQDHVLVVQPAILSAPTRELLGLRFKQFAAPRGTRDAIGAQLFLYIRSVLVPQEGTAYEHLGSPDQEQLEGFSLNDNTVFQILNHISTRGQGGFWILHPLENNWLKAPSSLPFTINGFNQSTISILSISCR